MLLDTLHSSGARGLDALEYYRYIAPLERRVAYINFNDTLMDFQRLATYVILAFERLGSFNHFSHKIP